MLCRYGRVADTLAGLPMVLIRGLRSHWVGIDDFSKPTSLQPQFEPDENAPHVTRCAFVP